MTGPVCIIGLGSMGFGAAISLLRAGFDVRGVDVRPEARERFAQAGGKAMSSPAEGAQGCSVVFVFVVNAAQTQAVLFGPDGAVDALAPKSVIAACATVAPDAVETLATALSDRGLLLLDAPVSGGAAKAATGDMTMMAAGCDEAFAAAAPFLGVIASKVYQLGNEPGPGSQMKLINQHLAGIHIAAAGEAMALAERAGLNLRTVYEVISNSAGASWMFQNRVAFLLDNDFAPRSAVDIFVKDLGLVLETSNGWTFPAPLAAAAHQLFKAASAAGLGGENDIAVVKTYPRALSGRESA